MPTKPTLAVLTLAALLSEAALPNVAPAQPPAPGAPAPPDPNAPRRPNLLSEVVEEVRWNVEQNGALLVVLPTRPRHDWYTPRVKNLAPLPPRSPSGLPMQKVEEYFESKVVPCGSVATIAPLTSSVLNYQNLPKPSAYAGVKPQDRLRFLQASLTPAQWQKVGSADGLGLNDLDGEQRELFQTMLPDNSGLYRQGESGKPQKQDITPAMRSGMRLHMARTVNYLFRRGNFTANSYSSYNDNREGWHIIEQAEPGGSSFEQSSRSLLGQVIRAEVPSRLKPTDLDFAWQGLDAPVRLDDLKTVGELIARIRAAAKIELFCDPRYRSLKVHTRGDQARAGDALKAVCRAVSGTVRRVGGEQGAFVLTDDLVGLGTRRALIRDWVEQNAALISARERKLSQALKKAQPASFLSYEPGDPMNSGAAILKKVAAHKPGPLTAEEASARDSQVRKLLWLPITALPAASQNIVRAELAQLQKDSEGQSELGAVHTDIVTPRFRSETYFTFPGIGKVKAQGWGDVSQHFPEPDPYRGYNYAALPWEKKPLTDRIARRAIIAWMESRADAVPIARAARRAGFTELWVDAPQGADPAAYLDVLAAGVKAAKAEGLTARVMARPLREAPSPTSPLTPERNLQGETWSQQAMRLQSGHVNGSAFIHVPDADDLTVEAAARVTQESFGREARVGDWMSLPTPAQYGVLGERVRELAAIEGVDGVVVRDLLPPGFEQAPGFSMGQGSQAMSLGFTAERRLRFLRAHGIDPVDLHGQGYNMTINTGLPTRMEGFALTLPMFPEEGTSQFAQLWDSSRRAEGRQAVRDLMPHLRQAAGNKPLWLYHSPTDPTGMTIQLLFVESLDKPIKPDKTAPVANAAPGDEQPFQDPAPAARQRSSLVLTSLQCQPVGSLVSPVDQFLREVAGLADPKYDPFKGYDGLVIDLNRRTPDAVRLHLDALPPFVPSRPAAKP